MVKKIPIEVVCPGCGITHIIAPWQQKRGQKYCCQEHEFAARKGKLRTDYTEEEKQEMKKKWFADWYAKNRDIVLIKKKERRSTPEAKAKEKIRRAKYFEDHKEEERAYHKWYNVVFAELIKESHKIYENTPKGRMARHRSIHKRRDRQLPVTLTLEQWNKIIEGQGNKCNLCQKPFNTKRKPTKDHILPLSKGHGLTFENTQALCGPCNSGKKDKLLRSLIHTWLIS